MVESDKVKKVFEKKLITCRKLKDTIYNNMYSRLTV